MDDKTIVLTLYGTKEAISDFSITLFDNTGSFFERSKAQEYCSNINELGLKDDNWVYAVIIKENQKTKLAKPGHTDFDDLCSLDDLSIRKVLREIDNTVLKKALKSAKKDVLLSVLRNMSKRSAIMLIEDVEYMDEIKLEEVYEARSQIVGIIHYLQYTGEVSVPKSSQDKVV